MKNKKFKIGISGIILLSIVLIIAYWTAADCCLNPRAGIQKFCREVPEKDCCPTYDANTEYYSDLANPYGPSDESECIASYFESGASCIGEADCDEVCCCDPLYPDVISIQDPVKRKLCGDLGGTVVDKGDKTCTEICEEVAPSHPSVDCSAPSNIIPIYKKGEKSVTLSWTTTESGLCPVEFYNITRCDDNGCKLIGRTFKASFTDDSSDLRWDKCYEYEVGVYYTAGNYLANPRITVCTGNLECWHRYDRSQFCIQKTTYVPFWDYLKQVNPAKFPAGQDLGQFYTKIESEYSNRINNAYRCDEKNTLSVSPMAECEGDTICVIKNDKAVCVAGSTCMPSNFDKSPFGLYSTEEECEDLGFCYFDKSTTLVGKCYQCLAPGIMTCYDYKSESACTKDNCYVGECTWKSLIPELGIGVCIDENPFADNCPFCHFSGAFPPENTVLGTCTQDKATLLSTENHQCCFALGKATDSSFLTCPGTSLDKCPADTPLLNNDNSLKNAPSDPCVLGICKKFGSDSCRKDANADGTPDCEGAEDEISCENDIFPPVTTITNPAEDGITRSLDIQRKDITRAGSVINPPGSSTCFCIDGEGESTCKNKPGKEFCSVSSTFDTKLRVNGLHLTNFNTFGEDRAKNFGMLDEGINTMYFYSVDSSKNLEIVQSFDFEAHAAWERPEIENIIVQDATKENDDWHKQYTNNDNPSIEIFLAGGGGTLEAAELLFAGKPVISFNPHEANQLVPAYVVEPEPADDVTSYKLVPESGKLAEGTYTLNMQITNAQGASLPPSHRSINIIISITAPDINIDPPPPDLIKNQKINLKINFTSKAKLLSVNISDSLGLENLGLLHKFPDEYMEIFEIEVEFESDGTKIVNVSAIDLFGNPVKGNSTFVVDAIKIPVLVMVEPTYGVSPAYNFKVKIQSDNDVTCKYNAVLDIDPLSYGGTPEDIFKKRLSNFDMTGKQEHIIDSYTINNENQHTIYVWCTTESTNEYYRTSLPLKVDTTPPEITVYTIPASPIGEVYEQGVLLRAVSQEAIICRYSKADVAYKDMANEFGGEFAELKEGRYKQETYLDLKSKGEYKYYVACRNKAGLDSDTKFLKFEINPDIGFAITDHTERFQSESSPTIAIGTNKRANCFVGRTENKQNILLSSDQDSMSHSKKINEYKLEQGSNTLYVSCNAINGGDFAAKEINIIVDTTSPNMEYVNDTSRLADRPEFTAWPNEIDVEWYATDEETGIVDGQGKLNYNFSLQDSKGNAVINWTDNFPSTYLEDNKFSGTINEDHNGNELNLSDNTKYTFYVKAGNVVGFWSKEEKSDGVTTDFSAIGNTSCGNDAIDGDETDTNCGGSCPSCANGKICEIDSDCKSHYCNRSDRCAAPTCFDKDKDGKETDVDCGGSECDKCPKGSDCKSDADCETGYCSRLGECADPDSCDDGKISPGETDEDCGGHCPRKCRKGQYCDMDSDCESDLECRQGVCNTPFIKEDDEDTDKDKIPDWWENQNNGMDYEDASDASKDFDGDGLTNLEEYIHGTDPNNEDTDGDGVKDKDEIDKGTDPNDPNSKPGGFLKLFLWILLFIALFGALGYFVYIQYFQKKKKAPAPSIQRGTPGMMQRRPMPMKRPMPMLRRPEDIRTRRLREKQKSDMRKSFLNAFGPQQKTSPATQGQIPKKPSQPSQQKQPAKVSAAKKDQSEVFSKLSSLIKKEGASKSRLPSPKKDSTLSATSKADSKLTSGSKTDSALKKLSELSKIDSSKIKNTFKQHASDMDMKLKQVEEKARAIPKINSKRKSVRSVKSTKSVKPIKSAKSTKSVKSAKKPSAKKRQ